MYEHFNPLGKLSKKNNDETYGKFHILGGAQWDKGQGDPSC